ncbi:MAG: hypothetical protein M1829_005931 [Trizodia sp. TS-e1964]|nr:MAG: hypothetical protein M1829_005931 [Trizodia sp. TS-e1964]
MTPNVTLVLRKAFSPSRWLRKRSRCCNAPKSKVEHWSRPVPGTYEYIPGRGWYMIEKDGFGPLKVRQAVVYCQVLGRWILQAEFECRSQVVWTDEGKRIRCFQLDDGVTWVNCWGMDGRVKNAPWDRWMLDEKNGNFRLMPQQEQQHWQKRTELHSSHNKPSNRNFTRPAARRPKFQTYYLYI